MIKKTALLFITVAIIVIIPFIIWGESIESYLTSDTLFDQLVANKSWIWILYLILLGLDVILPIPATVLFAILGRIYGLPLGFAIAYIGVVLANCSTYWIARSGSKLITKLASEKEQAEFRQFFERYGVIALLTTRSVPVIAEVIAVLAGVAKVPFKRCLLAIIIGSLPMTILFVYLGEQISNEFTMIAISALAPLIVLPIFNRYKKTDSTN